MKQPPRSHSHKYRNSNPYAYYTLHVALSIIFFSSLYPFGYIEIWRICCWRASLNIHIYIQCACIYVEPVTATTKTNVDINLRVVELSGTWKWNCSKHLVTVSARSSGTQFLLFSFFFTLHRLNSKLIAPLCLHTYTTTHTLCLFAVSRGFSYCCSLSLALALSEIHSNLAQTKSNQNKNKNLH